MALVAEVGEYYSGVLLELIKEPGISRPRVRAIEPFLRNMRVEFPRSIREEYPLTTRFRANVKVSQKTNKSDGSRRGAPYLVADKNSIRVDEDFRPNYLVFAVKISDRFYRYVEECYEEPKTAFETIRQAAYEATETESNSREIFKSDIDRQEIIREYALLRSNGVCEACQEEAPFIAKNEKPYLEVHHIIPLSAGGADSPINVAAICPNCHRRVDYGQDAEQYNQSIFDYVRHLENNLREDC